MHRARELARVIAAGAPLSVRATKELVRRTEMMSIEEAMKAIHARAFPIYAAMLTSEDRQEGPRAFAEKRKPMWKGR